MVNGRPSKYDPKYCKTVFYMMSRGYSKQAVAGKLSISRDTLYEWCRSHPDFSDSIKRGEAASLYFWEKTGMDGMMGKIKGFSAVTWIFIMKNRFQYRDEIQSSLEDDDEVDDVTEESLIEISAKYRKELEILDRIKAVNSKQPQISS